jgi:hypothetical protein
MVTYCMAARPEVAISGGQRADEVQWPLRASPHGLVGGERFSDVTIKNRHGGSP